MSFAVVSSFLRYALRTIFCSKSSTCTLSAFALLLVLQHVACAVNITIDTVPVGNLGNIDDTHIVGGVTYQFGAVSYFYNIGTTEVTNAQYAAFLNAKAQSDPFQLYDPDMADSSFSVWGGISRIGTEGSYVYTPISGRENLPVNYINWYDAIRFANWMHNGQGNGDTEEGAYTIGPVDSDGIPLNGGDIVRNPGATWFIPSEDEWYKAAFHKNDGVTANYFLYPTSSDILPSSESPPGGTNSANYDYALGGFPIGDMTEVGAYAATTSPYGAFDFAGNVYEWNESFRPDIEFRGIRGGAFLSPQIVIAADDIIHGRPGSADYRNGFRVATIPEPSTFALACMALLGGLFAWKVRVPR